MVHKRHIATFFALSGAVSFGSMLGLQAGADELSAAYLRPATSDPRHPVEVYAAPMFVRSLPEALAELGVTVAAEDHVVATPPIEFGAGAELVLERAMPITLHDGSNVHEVRTWANTVAELLAEQQIEVGDLDRLSADRTTVLTLGQELTITRVLVTEVHQTQAIAFTTKTQDELDRPKGQKVVLQKGQAGAKQLTYRVTRENGREIDRQLVNTEVTKEPIQEIVAVGTKPVITGWCKYHDWVVDAAAKNGLDPNALCYRMKRESTGNPLADSGFYQGLFQYDPYFWASVSAKAGYSGASIWDPQAQVYVTAWAWAHGYRGRWPNP